MITQRTETLTGNTKYRLSRRLFRPALIVLQVEARITGEYTTDLGRGGIEIENFAYTRWRDARPTDFLNSALASMRAKISTD